MTSINYSAALPVLRRGRERAAVGDGWVHLRNSFHIIHDDAAAYSCVWQIVRQPLFAWLLHHRTQAEVLELFDRAIAVCEAEIQKGGEA